MNVNQATYKALRSKSFNQKKSVYNFDAALSSVIEGLIPSNIGPSEKSNQADTSGATDQLAADYDKKLQLLEKQQNKKFGELSRQSSEEIQRLSEQVQSGDEQNLELSDSLKNAIEKLASQKQNEGQEQQQAAQPTDEAEETSEYGDDFEEAETTASPVPTTDTTKVNSEVAEKIVKKAVNIGDFVKVGDYAYKVTNLFGQREGKNAVSGVPTTEHSGGIDIVGFNKEGQSKNLPISLTDGTILSVTKQGSGKAIHPSKGRAAGYIMDVRLADGKVMKYMHLGEDAFKNKKSLIGKKIKRGDMLYEGNYSIGSGSQTAPHIKVRITSIDDAGKQMKDYSSAVNDPTSYALYGKYVE